MAARGLLLNPAMFAGFAATPDELISDYVYTSMKLGSRYEVFYKTLQWMCSDVLNKADRIKLNSCVSMCGVVDFLRDRGFFLGEPSSRLIPILV